MKSLKDILTWIIASVFIVTFTPTWAFITWVILQVVMEIILHILEIEDKKMDTLRFYLLCAAVGFPLLLILGALK
jgi:hypothetical protein